ncbi:MAG: DUF4175 family protein [Planctomycetota bacterium]
MRTLRRVIRRLRTVLVLRGLFAVVAVAIGALLAVMAVDAAAMIFSRTVRLLMTTGVLLATLAAAFWFLVRPLLRSFTLAGVARLVETHHPELEERISSAVELLSSHDASELRGSAALIAQLASEATDEVGVVEPKREVTTGSARPYMAAAAATLVVLAVGFVFWPTQVSRLLARAVAPHADIGNLGAFRMTVEPGDTVLPEGTPLHVEVAVEDARVDAAEFRRIAPTGAEVTETMEPAGESEAGRRFALTVPSGDASFRYRVRAGDGLSRYFTCTVVPPPVVERIDLRYDFPEYTGRTEPRVERNATGPIRALAGTEVTVTATTNKAMAEAELLVDGRAVAGRLQTADGRTKGTWSLTLRPEMVGTWWMEVRDEHGFGATSPEHEIEALADRPPTVRVTQPVSDKLTLGRSDRLPVRYRATDDFGIDAARFLVEIDGKRASTPPLPLPRPSPVEEGAWTGNAMLDLGSLYLAHAREVTFVLRVSDGLPRLLGGPQHALSRKVTIRLADSAPSYTDQQVTRAEARIREELQGVLGDIKAAREHLGRLKPAIDKKSELNEHARKQVDGAREGAAQAEGKMLELAARMERSSFAGLAPKTREVTDDEITPARKATEMIPLTNDRDERKEHHGKADRHLEQAARGVEQLLKDLKEHAERVRAARRLAELADRERDLAEQAKALAEARKPSEEAEARNWREKQRQVTGDVGEMVKESPDAKDDFLAEKQKEAEELAGRAEELAGEQEDLKDLTGKAFEEEGVQPEDVRNELLERVKEAQKQIAKETSELAGDVNRSTPQLESEHQAAAQSTQQAAQELDANQLARAADTGEQAAGELEQTAKDLGEQAAAPSQQQAGQQQPAQLQGRAQQLARQQKRVARQARALAKGDLDRALGLMQQDLGEQAKALAEQAARAEQQARDLQLSEQSERQAGQAAQELGRAGEEADRAAGEMAKAAGQQEPQADAQKPGEAERSEHGRQAGQHQQQAAQAMHNAARALQALGKGLAQQQTPGEQQAPSQEGHPLARAFEQASQAQQAPSLQQAQPSAQAAAQALQRAAQMAARQAQMPSSASMPQEFAQDSNVQTLTIDRKVVTGSDAAVAEKLKEMGIASSDWIRLPTRLRTQILQAADREAPEQYRALIQRYFRDLSRHGRAEEEAD